MNIDPLDGSIDGMIGRLNLVKIREAGVCSGTYDEAIAGQKTVTLHIV